MFRLSEWHYFNTKEAIKWSIEISLQLVLDHRKLHLCDHTLAIGASENLFQYCKPLVWLPGRHPMEEILAVAPEFNEALEIVIHGRIACL